MDVEDAVRECSKGLSAHHAHVACEHHEVGTGGAQRRGQALVMTSGWLLGVAWDGLGWHTRAGGPCQGGRVRAVRRDEDGLRGDMPGAHVVQEALQVGAVPRGKHGQAKHRRAVHLGPGLKPHGATQSPKYHGRPGGGCGAEMVVLDDVNIRLLNLLLKDARMPVTALAQQVGRSESTVRERLSSLERQGVLQSYNATVDRDLAGLPVLVVIRAKCDPAKTTEVARQLSALPNVTQALVLTGDRPILATIRVRDLEHLRSMLQSRLSGPLTDIEAEISLESLVDPRPPGLTTSIPAV